MPYTFDRNGAKRIVRAVRAVERAARVKARSRVYGPASVIPFHDFPFRCYINSDGDVVVKAGWRCVIDGDWQEVAETNLGAAGADKVVYMVYTYTVTGTPGAWATPVYGYATTPTVQDATRRVIRIASTISIGGVLVMRQEHFGNIAILDLKDC